MDKKQLFENEEILYQNKNGFFTLTTHRVRTNLSKATKNNIVSIMLEKISSIEVAYNNLLYLLIIGIALVCIGIGLISNKGEDEVIAITLIPGVIFIIAFFITRKSSIIISSDGGSKIFINTSGKGVDSIVEFIDKIEEAKNKRMVYLSK